MIGFLFSESIQPMKAKMSLRTGAAAAAMLVTAITFVQFRSDLGAENAYVSEESFGGLGLPGETTP